MNQEWVKKEDLPPDVKAAGQTLTLGEIRQALANNPEAKKFTIGFDVPGGFDTRCAARHMILYRNQLYLRVDTSLPKESFKPDVSWRWVETQHFTPLPYRNQIETFSTLTSELPDCIPVWASVQQQFSPRGPHTFVNLIYAGSETYVSGGPEYFVQRDGLSLYGWT